MRLTYNYTKGEFAIHPAEFQNEVLFTESIDDDTEKTISAFLGEGDFSETFDISHWATDDLMDFIGKSPLDQLGQLAGLSDLQHTF
jgi:hypothetical protein